MSLCSSPVPDTGHLVLTPWAGLCSVRRIYFTQVTFPVHLRLRRVKSFRVTGFEWEKCPLACVVLSCTSLEIQQVKEQEQEGITDGKEKCLQRREKFMSILRSSAKRQNAVRVITRVPWHAIHVTYTIALRAGGCSLQHINTTGPEGLAWPGLPELLRAPYAT